MLINVCESMHSIQLTLIKLYIDISEGWYKITACLNKCDLTVNVLSLIKKRSVLKFCF